MLNNLTLIIATKNRHAYLERLLNYYAGKGINIWVADATVKRYPKKLPDDNFSYFHYPDVHYTTKLNDLSKKITTRYSLLCADDDFIIPVSIQKAIDFLDTNPDYNSAQGQYISFYNSFGNLFYSPLYTQSVGLDLKSNKATERIKGFYNTSVQLYYCVHTTENFKKIFEFADGKIKNLNLLESVIGLITLSRGKHKVLPFFYSARESLYGSTGRSFGMDVFANSPDFKEQYEAFFNHIVKLITINDGITLKEATLFLQQTISSHIAERYNISVLQIVKQKAIALSKKIIPLKIRKFLRHQKLILNAENYKRQNIVTATKYGGYPFNDVENENLKEIESTVLKFNLSQ